MRRLLVPSFLVFVALSGCPLETHVVCPWCIDRDRDNSGCEWIGDTAFRFESGNPAHQRHLVQDAQLAEGLAVRFADAEHKRRFGIEHHGGLIDNGRIVRGCMSRLFSMIEVNHSVTGDQIWRARAERSRAFDGAVFLLFLPVYWFAGMVACRALTRRFSPDERRVRIVATALTSVAVSLLGCYLFVLWSMPWEAIRVGNGHIGGFRLATYDRFNLRTLFVGGVLLFWLIALLSRRVPSNLALGAATVSCAILAAMFVRTFATNATGYIAASLALLALVLAMGLAGRVGGAREAGADC